MAISASDVMALRHQTGAGMMDCKKALTETNGDVEKAIEFLRKKGMAAAAKRAERVTSQGIIGTYIHPGSQVGVLVEVNCETDFVARTDEFQQFVKDVAMHIAASNPVALSGDDLDPAVIEKEREIYRAQGEQEGKPAAIVEKIVEGRIAKFKKEVALLDQPFVKNPDETVAELLKSKIANLGENMSIRRFARFQIGD